MAKMRFVDLWLAMLAIGSCPADAVIGLRCLLACLAVCRDRGEPWLSCHATVRRFPFARTDRSSTRKCLRRFASAGTELDREAQRGSLDRRAQLRGRGTQTLERVLPIETARTERCADRASATPRWNGAQIGARESRDRA